MKARESRSARLEELDRRIAKARAAKEPEKRSGSEKFHAMNMAWRMVMELVAGMAVGLAMGWGLDSLFGTLPLFLIVMGLFGFAAGIRTVLRSAKELERRQAEADSDVASSRQD